MNQEQQDRQLTIERLRREAETKLLHAEALEVETEFLLQTEKLRTATNAEADEQT